MERSLLLMRVLVLGGGLAGLSAAVYTALAGHEVTLIEQEKCLGGKAGEYKRDGFRFDTGPSVLTLPHVLTDIFQDAKKTFPLELKPLDLLCQYHYPSGRVWNVYQDVQRTTEQLTLEEKRVYMRLLDRARRLYEAASPTFVYGQTPTVIDLLAYGLRHGLSAHPFQTVAGLVKSAGASDDLAQFFMRFATYFGADPYQAPAVLHNIAWTELGLGVYYPKGGIYSIVEALGRLATELGVELRTNEAVKQLEYRSGRVQTVHTASDNYKADAVISTLDHIRTHALLSKTSPQERLEPSLSGFVSLIGVTKKSSLTHHSIHFSRAYKQEFDAVAKGRFPSDPTLYINISSKTDRKDAPENSENWFVMANAPALRDEALDEEAYQERLLSILAKRGVLEKRDVVFIHSLGPRYLERYAHRGSIYGAAPHSLFQTLRPAPVVKGVKNLIMAGGTVYPGGGIPLVLLSGKAAAKRLES